MTGRSTGLWCAAVALAGWLLLSLTQTASIWQPNWRASGSSDELGRVHAGGDQVPGTDIIRAKIIVLAGGPNMDGAAGLTADLKSLAPELLQPHPEIPIYDNGAWSSLAPGCDLSGTGFGPELTFGRNMADALANDHIALIKIRSAGDSLAIDFDPRAPGSSWVRLIETVNHGLADLAANGVQPEVVGMIWSQGRTDARYEDRALGYEANLADFIQAVREEFGQPNLPFILERIPNTNTTDAPYMSVVSQAQLDVSAATPNTRILSSYNIPVGPDGASFTAAGQLEFGTRFADKMLDLCWTSRRTFRQL